VADSAQARKIHQQLLLESLQNPAITGCVLIMTMVAALADRTKAMAAKAMSLFIAVPYRNWSPYPAHKQHYRRSQLKNVNQLTRRSISDAGQVGAALLALPMK
jgi:hypothetical protein